MSAATRVATGLLAVGRAVGRALPPRLRQRVEDRFFFAVFQVTRVTNDAYGWRPPPAGDPAGPGAEGGEAG